MWLKLLLGALTLLMIAGAIYFEPARDRSLLGVKQGASDGARLKVLTWNVGYAALEDDTRAHTKDLAAVAETILRQDPDAVALQELTGAEQLRALLARLGGRYRGHVARDNDADRFEAVLVKQRDARFENVPTFASDGAAATFSLRGKDSSHTIVFVSAHADAFNAARRRRYTEEIIDWISSPTVKDAVVFVAGDFNFEIDSRNESNLYTDSLKHDSEAYNLLLRTFRDLGRDAGDTAINERRIDYVFGPPETALLRRAEVLRGAAVGRMDHWPLVVEVEL
ncbi:MAG: endonuclease/exonuclease/phosphatase family protein [Pyrinomonadaceae bacterium]